MADGSNLIDELLQKAGSAVGQIPVVGNVAKMGQSILTGPEGSQLTPTDQLTRALMSTVALASARPETYLSLLSAYQTHDVNLAATRRALLQSDALHQDWNQARANADNNQSDLEVWNKHMHQLYPELIGYNPIMQNGKIALPASVSEQNNIEARRAAQDTPPGMIVKTISTDPTKGVKASYGPMDVHAGEYPEGMLHGPFADPSLQAKLASGHFIPVATSKGPNGVQYYRLEQTEAGEIAGATEKAFATAQGGAQAKMAPLPGIETPPGTIAPPGSPAAYSEAVTSKKLKETQDVKAQSAADAISGLANEMTSKITPAAFPMEKTPARASEAFKYSATQRAKGLAPRTQDTEARQDYLAAVDQALPAIAQAAGVNRFNQNEISVLRSTLADPSLSRQDALARWKNFVDEARSRASGLPSHPLMGQEPRGQTTHGALSPEQRKKLEDALR